MSSQSIQSFDSCDEENSDFSCLSVQKNVLDLRYRNLELSMEGPRMLAKIEDGIVELKTKLAASEVLINVYSTILEIHKKCEKHKLRLSTKRTQKKFMKLLSENTESVKRIVSMKESNQGYEFEMEPESQPDLEKSNLEEGITNGTLNPKKKNKKKRSKKHNA
ncbi:hypothetical protein CANMA_000343 [Candida margitis]|uniref:uncharacterized protein n=1 Tax=Candida margitis TaxID=1775924 RepID=UPI0022265FB1|nr:uncharacterized protein CANMA_000343 [Candida margitis]KAI5970602.1 hypothetical protein CANMA_000343 [Candida margitis]